MNEFLEKINPLDINFSDKNSILSWIGHIAPLVILAIFSFLVFKYRKFIADFLSKTIKELKLIDWLERNKTYKYTFYTLLFVVFSTILILVLDQAFLKLRNLVILPSV